MLHDGTHLAFANFEKEFQLETNASSEGLGVMLSQKKPDGKWHPVAFGSCELKGEEAKYHSSKLEFLALKWPLRNSSENTCGIDRSPCLWTITCLLTS